MAEKILEVKNLTVSFGEGRVIDNVNFTVERGEVFALVGESGSGKTLTALSILDLLPPLSRRSSGKIIFEGKDILSLGPLEKRKIRGSKIAMVFQEPFTAFNPVIRVGDQIRETILAHAGKEGMEARVNALFDVVKLSRDAISKYPHELSGGMRQRAMLAMALSCEPSLLILDEPTTALDVSIQKHILDLIKTIQRERELSILFITHDFSIVNMIADTVCVMKKGKIVEKGGKKKIFNEPEHPYTKGLIACIPRLGDKRKRLPMVRDSY